MQKFYGSFNNILSILGHNRNEISAVYLVKTYCIPSLLYGYEIWSLNSLDYRKLNVLWNNAFRRIFQCCWRESVSCLLYYCKVMPMSYIIDQRKLLFLKKIILTYRHEVKPGILNLLFRSIVVSRPTSICIIDYLQMPVFMVT